MNMNLSTLEDLKLDTYEYCFLVGKQHHLNSTFRVLVPKVMPYILGTAEKLSPNKFNKNIFINDDATKPTIQDQVFTQNYITLKRSTNCNLSHLADHMGNIPANTKLRCLCLNSNPKDLLIIDG